MPGGSDQGQQQQWQGGDAAQDSVTVWPSTLDLDSLQTTATKGRASRQ